MAIAEMSRMRLIGISSECKKLLAELHKTCAIQIINKTEREDSPVSDTFSCLNAERERLDFACKFLFENATAIARERSQKPPKEELYGVTYDQFISALDDKEFVFKTVAEVEDLNGELISARAKIAALNAERTAYMPYNNFDLKFSDIADTTETRAFFGTMQVQSAETFISQNPDVKAFIECKDSNVCVLSCVCLKSDENSVIGALSSLGFNRCSFKGDFTARQKIEELDLKLNEANENLNLLFDRVMKLFENIEKMKILLDRLDFELEKQGDEDNFSKTDYTYTVEAYVPTEAIDRVKTAIDGVTGAVFYEFETISRDDYAPTLMRNRPVTKQFEFVTNMYSPPTYGSIDHTFVMMLFFSFFLGFITADWGYGLLMMIGGAVFAKKLGRDVGIRRLTYVIVVGGFFTILFGLAFDSFFGAPLLQNFGILSKPLMPDATKDVMSISGINVPKLLMLSLGFGVVQIIASLLLKAGQEFMHKRYLDGICDGIVWAIFLTGLLLLVLDLGGITHNLTKASIIIIIASLAVGALTAGRHEKGFGKFTKGFGALYGIINYLSDILSYARLYGLMLSGAQIASIVTSLALPMMTGVGGTIAGVVILIIGHAFNIAMGLLGAYIHDCRLQYIEFFGRFYEGDGDLFTPFGTTFKNIYLADK